MRGHVKLVALGGALPTIAVVMHGCQDPTQVTVEVKTNVVCADMRGVDVAVGSDPSRAEERASLLPTSSGPRFPSGTTTDCTEGPPPRHVGTIVVTPSGTAGAVVVIAAFGETNVSDCVAPHLPARCIIARRRFSFVENRRITMPIVLDPECAGVPCNETSTCVGKKCVDSEVDCSGAECTEPGVAADGGVIEVDGSSPLVDGSPPVDSGPDDAASDGDGPAIDSGPDGNPGFDGGTGTCAKSQVCLPPMDQPGTGITCIGGTDPCCYRAGTFGCAPFSECMALAACCRGAGDCETGEVCCADSKVGGTTTRITCKNAQECVQTGGVRVCSAQDQGCGGLNCSGDIYWANPEYFHCS